MKAKTQKSLSKGMYIAFGIAIAFLAIVLFVGGNNQQAQAQKMEDSGVTISFSENLATQFLALIAGVIGGDQGDQNDTSAIGGTTQGDWNVGGNLSITGSSTFATSTATASFDGFMVGGSFSVAATNTPVTLYTHSGGPAICDTSVSGAYWDSTAFSPTLIFSMATSTSAATPGTNLIASTTIASTTDSFIPSTADYLFRMDAGETIVGLTANVTGDGIASTTHYGNWDVEYQLSCWSIGG